MERLAEIDAAKRALEARVRECLASRDGERTPAGGGWTLKEMVAHIAFWEEAAVAVISYMFRDLPVPPDYRFGSGYVPGNTWPRADVHNAREAEWARGQSMDSVLDRWDRAYTGLVSVLETVSAVEAEEHAAYFTEMIEHLREHGALLEAPAQDPSR